MIKKISHVMLWSGDLDNTIKWYMEKLDFHVNYHAKGEFASLSHDEMGRLDFHAAGEDRTQIGKGPLPYYIVKDIEAVKIWLENKSIKVNDIQQVGDSPKHTWFWDCEGNVLGLEEY